MQKFKSQFKDQSYKTTVGNIQSCLRLNDLDEIGDGTHLLYFNMIGLFSFRQMSVQDTISFWFEFLSELDLKPDHVTVHPNKYESWKNFYDGYQVPIVQDLECTWSDGDLGGYCTEFFINDVEIGNIVNTNSNCIDVGFGLERLELVMGSKPKTDIEILKETVIKIIDSGYKPGPNKQGYVLRKLLRLLVRKGEVLEHKFFDIEKERQEQLYQKYQKIKKNHTDKTKEWWYDTHGIDISDFE